MEEFIAYMVEVLQMIIAILFENYYSTCMNYWMEAMSGFNSGQLSIAGQDIIPAIEDYMSDAAESWAGESSPEDVEPGEYVDTVYDSYDSDVIDRAFSETVYGPLDQMTAIWEHAVELQMYMEVLETLDFFDMEEGDIPE